MSSRPKRTILLVEDEVSITEPLAEALSSEGFETQVAGTVAEALELARRDPDLVLLDLMLPDGSGFDVCRELRKRSQVPIIMLTARGEEADRVVGLELGADDYVVKPFSAREVVARIRAVLRRTGAQEQTDDGPVEVGALRVDPARREERLAGLDLTPTKLSAGPITIDTAARIAYLDGTELDLTHREFDLLAYLVSHPGKAYTKAELLRRVWGWDFGDSSTVTVHVRRLREKLEPDPTMPRRIVTVWGVGYRYEPEAG